MRKIVRIFIKAAGGIFAAAAFAFLATSFSPVFRFSPSEAFRGPDIFDPYDGCSAPSHWLRAAFHTHTRVKGPFNECRMWPLEVYDSLAGWGTDIITFSNHNALTAHPFDSSLQVNVYEHGYNLFKYHKLVFGCSRVMRLDHLLPLFTFQKQWQLDLLGKDSDIIQINHPYRTRGMSQPAMEKLSGYRLIELDSGCDTRQGYWDWALSAGHYSFATASDDLHYPDRIDCVARRCTFLDSKSAKYEDIRQGLLSGHSYCMRLPVKDSWSEKHEANRHLPAITSIGLDSTSTIRLCLSTQADSIIVTGQNGRTLKKAFNAASMDYLMAPADSYARLTAYFSDGSVIYTNPFARYDKTKAESPFSDSPHHINWILTILYNLVIVLLLLQLLKFVRRYLF